MKSTETILHILSTRLHTFPVNWEPISRWIAEDLTYLDKPVNSETVKVSFVRWLNYSAELTALETVKS
jgi:hypothetical protein